MKTLTTRSEYTVRVTQNITRVSRGKNLFKNKENCDDKVWAPFKFQEVQESENLLHIYS